MVPKPGATGLWICDRVLVEEGTRSISMIASHTRRRYRSFPAEAKPFFAFAVVTGGTGAGRMELRILDAEELAPVARRIGTIRFPDQAAELMVLVRFRNVEFRHPGTYSVGLFVDDELIAERQLRVFT